MQSDVAAVASVHILWQEVEAFVTTFWFSASSRNPFHAGVLWLAFFRCDAQQHSAADFCLGVGVM